MRHTPIECLVEAARVYNKALADYKAAMVLPDGGNGPDRVAGPSMRRYLEAGETLRKYAMALAEDVADGSEYIKVSEKAWDIIQDEIEKGAVTSASEVIIDQHNRIKRLLAYIIDLDSKRESDDEPEEHDDVEARN